MKFINMRKNNYLTTSLIATSTAAVAMLSLSAVPAFAEETCPCFSAPKIVESCSTFGKRTEFVDIDSDAGQYEVRCSEASSSSDRDGWVFSVSTSAVGDQKEPSCDVSQMSVSAPRQYTTISKGQHEICVANMRNGTNEIMN